MPHGTQPTEEQWRIAEALDNLVMSKGVVLDDDRLDWLTSWVAEQVATAYQRGMKDSADMADAIEALQIANDSLSKRIAELTNNNTSEVAW